LSTKESEEYEEEDEDDLKCLNAGWVYERVVDSSFPSITPLFLYSHPSFTCFRASLNLGQKLPQPSNTYIKLTSRNYSIN